MRHDELADVFVGDGPPVGRVVVRRHHGLFFFRYVRGSEKAADENARGTGKRGRHFFFNLNFLRQCSLSSLRFRSQSGHSFQTQTVRSSRTQKYRRGVYTHKMFVMLSYLIALPAPQVFNASVSGCLLTRQALACVTTERFKISRKNVSGIQQQCVLPANTQFQEFTAVKRVEYLGSIDTEGTGLRDWAVSM